MRIVEYGKKYVSGGATDFTILAASDKQISSSVDYFRRDILLFPNQTSFSNKVGNISCGLLSFPEGYLFVQLQSRREDEIEGEKSSMRRPFTQLRFSFLEKDEFTELLKQDIAIYTSLLFNNPDENIKKGKYRLADYHDLKKTSVDVLSVVWKPTETIKNELGDIDRFESDLNEITHTLYQNFNTQKKDKQTSNLLILQRKSPKGENERLFYNLALLQKAQQELYPTCGIITFTLDHISEQRVNIKMIDSIAEESKNDKTRTLLSDSNAENPRSRLKKINAYRDIYDKNFQEYYSAGFDLKVIEKIYSSIFDSKLENEARKKTVELNYTIMALTGKSPDGRSSDLTKSFELFPPDFLQKWSVSENNIKLRDYILIFLSIHHPKTFIVTCSQFPDLDIQSVPAQLIKVLAPVIEPGIFVSELNETQTFNIWRLLFLLSTNDLLLLNSGVNVLEVAIDLIYTGKDPSGIKQALADHIIHNHKNMNLLGLSNPISPLRIIPTTKVCTQIFLTQPIHNSNISQIIKYITDNSLKLIAHPEFVTHITQEQTLKANMLDESSQVIKNIKELTKEALSNIILSVLPEIHEQESFTKVCNLIASKDMVFAQLWLVDILTIAIKNKQNFQKMFNALCESCKNSIPRTEQRDTPNTDLFYILSNGEYACSSSLKSSLKNIYNFEDYDKVYFSILELWLFEKRAAKPFKLITEDAIEIINELEKSNNLLQASNLNNLLIKVSQEQNENCKDLPSTTADLWLRISLVERTDPSTGSIFSFYSSYSAYINGNKINYLFRFLNNIESPSAELLWKLSSLPESINLSNKDAQNQIRSWAKKTKEKNFSHSELNDYLSNALVLLTKNEGDIRALLAILRDLVEAKHKNKSYTCKNDVEAIQLGIIKENINDEEIKRLAGQLLQKYISNNKQISEKLMVYLLGSDNQIEQAATKNYITLLLSENRLKSQLNILNNFAIQRIYECAVNIPMQINIINLIEERMAQLGINFEPFHPHYEPPQQIDPTVTVNNNQPNNSRKDHVAVSLLQTTQNPTQKGDINKEKGNIIPRIKNQENRGADKIANLEENNIVVNKTVYYFLIIFLIIFAALDIALLINYYELIKVIQTMPIGN